jgi:cell shape-determining protein MreD
LIGLLRRALAAPVLLLLAVVLQVSLVNRLPLPGHASPNLVILVVVALAATTGPMTGVIAGFLGGLALDIAPPGTYLVGQTALVCCLVGYGCGALGAWQRSPRTPGAPHEAKRAGGALETPLQALPVVVAGVVVAEALQAGLGMMFSNPSMTMPTVRHVLPAAVIYDLLLCPFILVLVAAMQGDSELGGVRRPAQVLFASPKSLIPARPAVRAAAAVSPGLTFAGTRPDAIRAPGRPDPKLRFSSGNSPALRAQSAGSAAHPSRLDGPRGSAWLRDDRSRRRVPHPGSALDGASLRRGPGQGGSPKVAFRGGRRSGAIGGSVLGNGYGAFSFGRSSGGFSGALGPSLFADSRSRRSGGFRGSALKGSSALNGSGLGGSARKSRVIRGSAFRGGALNGSGLGGSAVNGSAVNGRAIRGGAFKGSGMGSGAPGSSALRKRSLRKGAFTGGASSAGGLNGSGLHGSALNGTARRRSRAWSGVLGSTPLAGRAARSTGIGARAFQNKGEPRNWLPGSGYRRKTPGRNWLRGNRVTARSEVEVRSGPGKGWLRPARPPAPVRSARPGRGWLSRKPPKLLWQRAVKRRGPLGTQSLTGKTRIGGRR